jgi:hypothetical protein
MYKYGWFKHYKYTQSGVYNQPYQGTMGFMLIYGCFLMEALPEYIH